jgi:hypothetical protein
MQGATMAYMNSSRRLDNLILQSSADQRGASRLASWIFDLSEKSTRGLPLRKQAAHKILNYGFCASGVSAAQSSLGSPQILRVSGLKLATIETVGDALPGNANLDQLRKSIADWEPEDSVSRLYITGEPRQDAFVSTVALNFVKNVWAQNYCPSISSYKRVLNMKSTTGTDSHHETSESTVDGLISNVIRGLEGWTFISTREGYIGVTTAAAQPGTFPCKKTIF